MSFKLDSLQPKLHNAEIVAYGEKHIIPLVPLTYTEYHNAGLGLTPPDPDDYKVRKLVNGKHTDVLDPNNPDYIKAQNNYFIERNMRRLAKAMEKGGVEELQGLSIEEQVEQLRSMDAGIAKALYDYLEREANHKIAKRFQPVPANGSADLPETTNQELEGMGQA